MHFVALFRTELGNEVREMIVFLKPVYNSPLVFFFAAAFCLLRLKDACNLKKSNFCDAKSSQMFSEGLTSPQTLSTYDQYFSSR